MEQIFLLVIQFMVIAVLVWKTYKRDKVQAVFIAGIYIYTVFTEINYAFYPAFIGRYIYVNTEYWFRFYMFVSLSFLCLYIFAALMDHIKLHFTIKVTDKPNRFYLIPTFVYNSVLVVSIIIIFLHWNEMSYTSNVLKQYSSSIAFVRKLNDWNVYYFLIMLTAARCATDSRKKRWFSTSSALCFCALLLFTYRNGDRSVIVLCLIGLFIYYFFDKQLSFKNIRKMLPFVAIAFAYLFFVRLSRSNGSMTYELVRTFLQDDYAFPGMTLIAVIQDAFIHPIAVIKAFITKASFVFSGEYLYWIVYKAEFPIFIQQALATGTNPGIGFHIFTEGYVFAGFGGFLYNGLMISIHLKLWKFLYTTNDSQTNTVMAAIIAGVFILGIRTETVYFVRNFVFFMIPAIIIYILTCNKKIRFVHVCIQNR